MQTLIFRGITGAMRITPTAAVDIIVSEEPIHIPTIAEAAQTMRCLTAMGKWMRGTKHTRLPMDITELPTLSMRHDKTVKKYNFDKIFRAFFQIGSKVSRTCFNVHRDKTRSRKD